MKIALVHELLTMKGGAEKVAKVFADLFPDAPIYTLLYDEQKLGDWFPKERVHTSQLQHRWFPTPYPLLPTPYRFNHHLYLRKFPAAVEAWPFDSAQGDNAFDLVISSSSAFVHGIITNGKPKHLCYVHSPARYLWDRTHDVLERASTGWLGSLRRWYLEHTFHSLRVWDAEAADRPDTLIAASREVQRRIELYWRRPSEVIYPPVDDFWFAPSPPPVQGLEQPGAMEHPHYALVVSTLVPYKRIDLAIHACEKAGIFLKIVGEGPAMASLKRMAGKDVEFYGHRTNDELKDLYRSAQVTIVPGEEDFNLVALESMACGTPVLAYRAGGPLETIIEGKNGTFFDEPTADSLAQALRKFKREDFDPAACRTRAKEFSRKQFEDQITHNIATLMNS